MMSMLRSMSLAEAERARGNPATLTVVRDGQRITRTGPLGRVTVSTVFVGVFCYSRNEADPTLQVEEER
jgi:hypothetical protein